MSSFSNADGASVVIDMIATIKENREYLSDIDGQIGDGDHGINMAKGFSMTGDALAGKTVGFAEALDTLGFTLVSEIGGSMGPLYGNMFMEMAAAVKGKEPIQPADFSAMLHAGIAAIQALGDAKVGDKTLMDTLVPAAEAFDGAVQAGKGFADALADMEAAAEQGKDSTKDLVAKIGRASRLGERSRGVLDAGATSCYLLLSQMARSITPRLAA